MYQTGFNWVCSWEILKKQHLSCAPIAGLSSIELRGVRYIALPLFHIKPSSVLKLWMLYFQTITLEIICLFKSNKHELIDPKAPENIIFTMMKYGETFRAATRHLTPPAMTIIKFWKRWSFRSKGVIQAANIPGKRSQSRLCSRTDHRYYSVWCSPPFLPMLSRTSMIAFQSDTALMATCSTFGWTPNQGFRQTCKMSFSMPIV